MTTLYQQQIMELANLRRDDLPLTAANVIQSKRHNPLCGDSVTLFAQHENHAITSLSQQVRGCVLCSAATQQLLSIIARENNTQQLATYCTAAETMFAGGDILSPLTMFSPVITHPARHECVLLPFRTLSDILININQHKATPN